ncbi:hypothetical protein H4R34_003066 [Dimargaris verticillata]|uniref:Uncharacterized protein n=1 Tax=Dimargaris verticillata TaxID=2761393 RepID=A0A9W8B6T1_9FUNG|nr:hypothetical protein H4R34_003066 [Dimargaris verticillata]
MFRTKEVSASRPGTPSSGSDRLDPSELGAIAGVPSNKITSRARVNKANIIGPSTPTATTTPPWHRYAPCTDPVPTDLPPPGRQPPWHQAVPVVAGRQSVDSSSYSYEPAALSSQPTAVWSHLPPTTTRSQWGRSTHTPAVLAGTPHKHSKIKPTAELAPYPEPPFPVRHRGLPPSPFSQHPLPSSPTAVSPLDSSLHPPLDPVNSISRPWSSLSHSRFSPPVTNRTYSPLPFPALSRSPTSVVSADMAANHSPSRAISPDPRNRSMSKVFSENGSRPVPTGPNARIIKPRPDSLMSPSPFSTSHPSAEPDGILDEGAEQPSEGIATRTSRIGSISAVMSGNGGSQLTAEANDAALEARTNRRLEDLKITNRSLLAINRIYEDKILEQRNKIIALEKRLGIRPGGAGQSEADKDLGLVELGDLGLAEDDHDDTPLPLDPKDEKVVIANDRVFARIIHMVEVMMHDAKTALTYEPEINAGKVLTRTEMQVRQIDTPSHRTSTHASISETESADEEQVPIEGPIGDQDTLQVAQAVLDFVNNDETTTKPQDPNYNIDLDALTESPAEMAPASAHAGPAARQLPLLPPTDLSPPKPHLPVPRPLSSIGPKPTSRPSSRVGVNRASTGYALGSLGAGQTPSDIRRPGRSNTSGLARRSAANLDSPNASAEAQLSPATPRLRSRKSTSTLAFAASRPFSPLPVPAVASPRPASTRARVNGVYKPKPSPGPTKH